MTVNTVLNYFSKKLTLFKRFLGFDKTNICGYLYLVTLDVTIYSPLDNNLSSTKVKNIKIVVKVTPDENKLSKDEFSKLITSRSRTTISKCYNDLVDIGGTTYNRLIWASIIDRLSHMRICPVYMDELGKLAV